MDAIEADGTVYIMTERVKPLSVDLSSWEAKPAKERQDWLLWGLHRITVRLAVPDTSPRIGKDQLCFFSHLI
jgi:SCY1-like protein 1